MSKSRQVQVRAAGALVWRPNTSGKEIDVLLIHRPRWKDWSFPKGKVKHNEPLHRCAVREVYEETGEHIVLGQPVGWQHYETHEGKWKEVRYWSATTVNKSHTAVGPRPKFHAAKHSEVDETSWVPASEAIKLLTSDDDRALLKRLIRHHDKGNLDSTPLCFVRHTRAKSRSAWKKGKGGEATRPLTDLGERRAEKLADLLADYGVERLVSSPWKRCVDTLKPYAKKADLHITTRDSLTEASYRKSPVGVEKTVRNGIEKHGGAAAVSLHRPTLPTVLATLRDYTSKTILKQIPSTDPWLETGGVIVAHVVRVGSGEPFVAALEKHRPVVLD